MQLTLVTFLTSSALFVVVLSRLNLKFFGHQLESSYIWSTVLKLLRASLANFLLPSVTLWVLAIIFVLVLTDFLSFRFVRRLIALALLILRGVHYTLYLVVFMVPTLLGRVNFLVFFMLPFTTIFFTKSLIVLESLRVYLLTYLSIMTIGLSNALLTGLIGPYLCLGLVLI